MAKTPKRQEILLGEYQDFRNLLHQFAVYGYRSMREYRRIDLKEKNYSQWLTRLQRFLDEMSEASREQFVRQQEGKNVYWRIVRHPLAEEGNLLAEISRFRAIDEDELRIFYAIIKVLEKAKREYRITELSEKVQRFLGEKKSRKQITRCVRELERLELLSSNIGYRLTWDVLKELDITYTSNDPCKAGKSMLQELYEYLEFLEGALPFELPYQMLKNKIGLYLGLGKETGASGIWIFAERSLTAALDNEVLYAMLRAKKAGKPLAYLFDSASLAMGRKSGAPNWVYKNQSEVTHIRYSCLTGIWKGDGPVQGVYRPLGSLYKLMLPLEEPPMLCTKANNLLLGQLLLLWNHMETEQPQEWERFFEKCEKRFHLRLDSVRECVERRRSELETEQKVPILLTRVEREALKSIPALSMSRLHLPQELTDHIRRLTEAYEASFDMADVEITDRAADVTAGAEIDSPTLRTAIWAARRQILGRDGEGRRVLPCRMEYSFRRNRYRILVWEPDTDQIRLISPGEFTVEKQKHMQKNMMEETELEKTYQQTELMDKAYKAQKKLCLRISCHTGDAFAFGVMEGLLHHITFYERTKLQVYTEDAWVVYRVSIRIFPQDEDEVIETLHLFENDDLSIQISS